MAALNTYSGLGILVWATCNLVSNISIDDQLSPSLLQWHLIFISGDFQVQLPARRVGGGGGGDGIGGRPIGLGDDEEDVEGGGAGGDGDNGSPGGSDETINVVDHEEDRDPPSGYPDRLVKRNFTAEKLLVC